MNNNAESGSSPSSSQTTTSTSFYTNLKEINKQTSLTESEKINKLFERIFQLTLDTNYSNLNNKCVYIGELIMNNDADSLLMKENLDEILLQRLMMNDRKQLEERVRPSCHQLNESNRQELKCLEPCQFNYLFESFVRLNESKRHFIALERLDLFEFCSNLIINICRTILNIFESSTTFDLSQHQQQQQQQQNIDQSFLNNKEDLEYNLIKNNSNAMSDLSIQFVLLIIDNFDDPNTSLSSEPNSRFAYFEQFYDKFVNLFQEADSVRNIMDKADYFNNEINTEQDLINLLELDSCEIKFLNNLFIYMNKYFIKLTQCDDYTNKYIRNIELIKFMTRHKLTKYLLIFNSFVSTTTTARDWQANTIIGKLLTAHSLPIATSGRQSQQLNIEYRYFTNPTQLTKRDIESNEKNIWQIQLMIKKQQQSFFFEHLIRKNSNRLIRDLWLKWLGKCMFAHKAKTQEWMGYMQTNLHLNNNEHLTKFSSDGFFLNLLDCLLEYSMPFCSPTSYSNKLLKINYNYANSSSQTFIHELDKETKLISSSSAGKVNEDFNFITECFYATHSCIRLAYISLYQKLMKLNGELSRWQSTYQQLMDNSMMSSNDPHMSRLKSLYENMTIEFLNIKSALLDNDLLSKLIKFLTSTSSWLVYIAIYATSSSSSSSTDQTIKQLSNSNDIKQKTNTFNLNILSSVPEYFLTNVVEFLIFLSRFKDNDIVDLLVANNNNNNSNNKDYSNLNSLISLFLVFMGNSDRLFNPHCRASLVEAIEILMPKKQTALDYFHRKQLAYYVFAQHPCACYLSEALINVFVSIEMTGQSVQFEQKFNYRRPMYELLEFLWNMPITYSDQQINNDDDLQQQHRKQINKLADEAFLNINNSEQPLFLKFLNFLINDANYLLLEGLLYLEKIKTLQDKIENEQQQQQSSTQLTQQQRNEQEANLKHMIMIAKFHNMMSTKTIQTIKMLTTQITNIFCHDVLVDRIATMLNDFLLHLVGKKRRQFKVKNLEEVEFHPKEIVSNICDIYLNLGNKSDQFCRAICRDGRSYSADLFQQAINVLSLIDNRDYDIINKFKKLGHKIEEMFRLQQLEELNFDDAPDEYLDPIMSILMNDPVILPNSKKIVDRSTIARHLLSDQSDPFNRSPLSLQDVIPATELKEQIEQWKTTKLNGLNNNNNNNTP